MVLIKILKIKKRRQFFIKQKNFLIVSIPESLLLKHRKEVFNWASSSILTKNSSASTAASSSSSSASAKDYLTHLSANKKTERISGHFHTLGTHLESFETCLQERAERPNVGSRTTAVFGRSLCRR